MSFLKREDGLFTANAVEIDNLVHKAWMPIFRAYSSEPEPEWEPFSARFGAHIAKYPMQLQALEGKHLRQALEKMADAQAGGVEGWRVAELKRLPKPLLNRLAALFNVIEKTSRWPKCLERSLVTLVQKSTGHNTNPEDLRPITVMSAIYRLWASTRVRNVMEWQEQWAAQGQHGGRTGRGTDDVYWQLALQLEEALCSGRPLYGCCLDYSKCFDRLPQRILLRLAKELGMNELVLAPLTAMYSNLRRRFKYAGFVGEEYTTTNGILQGCPLSMVLLNALVSVWCRAVEVEAPDAAASATSTTLTLQLAGHRQGIRPWKLQPTMPN